MYMRSVNNTSNDEARGLFWLCSTLFSCHCFCCPSYRNLSSNHLSRLEESSFVGLSLLDELHIGNNRVSFIADGAFRGLSNLQMLWVKFRILLPNTVRTFPGSSRSSHMSNDLCQNVGSLSAQPFNTTDTICYDKYNSDFDFFVFKVNRAAAHSTTALAKFAKITSSFRAKLG